MEVEKMRMRRKRRIMSLKLAQWMYRHHWKPMLKPLMKMKRNRF
ncbi:hypothetical protein AB205_0069680 [Aquarana catesbeiana]|uniref:Uncharacterized protein n=1 Tax=Aquarana catesbeiana TaxID=8400 RepID=A0A2G9RDV6_AQUCT|nr:hypothetical protein AB205_0069680 [Aquarana catesbeiana]